MRRAPTTSLHDTLARAWEKRPRWRAGSDLRAWLFTIMHNLYVNQLALARREAGNISLDAVGSRATRPGSRRWTATNWIAWHLRQLGQQLCRLPAEQREVLLLAAVEDLHYDEIAAALAIPVGTVMSRLSRARVNLRRLIAEPPAVRKSVK